MNSNEKTVDGILANLFITTLKIEERAISEKSDHVLSISELHVLRVIGDEGNETMGAVAAGLKISVGALTTAVTKLENKGYVIRKRDETDKRIVLVTLTDKGRNAYHTHENYHRGMVSAAVDILTPEEKEVLLKSLIKLEKYFDDEWRLCSV